MRYKIEYLAESDDAESVFLAAFSDGELDEARAKAYSARPVVETAEAFQIRDLSDGARIVAFEAFDD